MVPVPTEVPSLPLLDGNARYRALGRRCVNAFAASRFLAGFGVEVEAVFNAK
jgi:hypothetical protein